MIEVSAIASVKELSMIFYIIYCCEIKIGTLVSNFQQHKLKIITVIQAVS